MRGNVALMGVLVLAAPALAQDKADFDAAEGLYALKELHEGGRPLYRQLFHKGWPTDKKHLDMTVGFAAAKAELLTRCYLAAGAGVGQTVPYSDYQFGRLDWRAKKGQRFTNTASLLNEELRVFRHLSATRLRTSTHGLRPPYLPFARSKPVLADSWDPETFTSWRWASGKGTHSLEALGLAMVLEATYAREQLSETRKEEQKGKQVDLYGQTALDGFFALTGLHAAAAQVWALRNTLSFDYRAGKIRRSAELSILDKRRFFYPTAWTTDTSEGRAIHAPAAVGTGDTKFDSSLRAQAAILWGVSELAGLTSHTANKELQTLFKQRIVRGQQWWLFDYRFQKQLIEVALFTAESIRTLHLRLEGKGRAASSASPKGRGRYITPEDQGMLVLALEAFVNRIELSDRARESKELKKALEEEQRKAKRVVADLARTFRTWQANQVGYFDRYQADSDDRASKSKSLLSQAFAVRGLVAAHRALKPNRDTFLRAARRALNWLDTNRWDSTLQAYVEKSKKGVDLKSAMAILGALREMALATGDGRYLLRYEQYLTSLRAGGLYREPGGSTPPGLNRVITFTKSK